MSFHTPTEMQLVDEFEEYFMREAAGISTYKCPTCNKISTDFTKKFVFHPEYLTCEGQEDVQATESVLSYDQEIPF